MKITQSKTLLLAGTALAIGLCVAASSGIYNAAITVPAVLNGINAATVTTNAGTGFDLPHNGKPVTLEMTFTPANGGNSNIVVGFNYAGPDGTWSTTLPLMVTNTLNGTNPVTSWTEVPYANYANAGQGRLDYASTAQTNAVTIAGKVFWDP